MTRKPLRNYAILPVCLIIFFISSLAGDQGTLAELYRKGKVRLVPELIIDAKSLPKDVLFVGLTAIASDSEGNIYVLDASDNNIKKFDPSGKLVKVIGRKGQGPGEFNLPYEMAVAGDRLLIYDMGNWRLSQLALDGTLIKNVPLSSQNERPIKIMGFHRGEFVLETEKTYYGVPDKPQDRRIAILDPDLKPKTEIYFGSVLRNIYLVVPSKSITNVPQPFCADIHWDVSPSGNILVGFSDKYEVSIFSANKEELGLIDHAWNPIKVTDEDKKKWFDGMGQVSDKGAKLGAPDFIVKATKFPRFKPAFDEVLWDPEGNILIHPILKEGQSRYYDAFTPKGKFIARVEFVGSPPYFYSQQKRVTMGSIWACETDANGYYRVVKWRLSQ